MVTLLIIMVEGLDARWMRGCFRAADGVVPPAVSMVSKQSEPYGTASVSGKCVICVPPGIVSSSGYWGYL